MQTKIPRLEKTSLTRHSSPISVSCIHQSCNTTASEIQGKKSQNRMRDWNKGLLPIGHQCEEGGIGIFGSEPEGPVRLL